VPGTRHEAAREREPPGFDLLRERKKIFSPTLSGTPGSITVGLPAALHLYEDLLVEEIFDLLSIRTVTSEDCSDALKEGNTGRALNSVHPWRRFTVMSISPGQVGLCFLPFYLEKRVRRKGSAPVLLPHAVFAFLLWASGDGKAEKTLTPWCIPPRSFRTKIEPTRC
jgi:hypothetical protein